MAPQCSALNVSDQLRCEEGATSLNRLFCSFHSRQCQALYKGYKRRNAQMDELDNAKPQCLTTSTISLANQTFADVGSERVLQEIYDHLSKKQALLDRVIRARKLHHSRFFSLELDYGHQHYLDGLSNQKFLVSRALERLERRTAEVLYERQKWFKWVRQLEDDEESQRENEKKKIKREAALFRRHEKEVQRRRQVLKAKEDTRRQELALEEAIKKRAKNEDGLSDNGEEDDWDPIEDALEFERGSYVALIRHFLLMVNTTVDESDGGARQPGWDNEPSISQLFDLPSDNGATVKSSVGPKTSEKARKGKMNKKKGNANGTIERRPSMSAQDSTKQIRDRLREGVKHSYASGPHVAGTINNPVELMEKTAPFPDEEIDQLLLDIAEIKQLLLCRLLLSHATLLPAALKADSINGFLDDKDIADGDLRDLCLKIESPGLQEMRDACADLGRSAEDGDEEPNKDDDRTSVDTSDDDLDEDSRAAKGSRRAGRRLLPSRRHKRALPNYWAPDREKQMQTRRQVPQSLFEDSQEDKTHSLIDFGDLDAEGRFKPRKVRVKVCGKYIYNYPSEKSIPRRGWLQFSIIAKDSHLYDVIKLCRNWDEFWELNVLVNFRYFPAAHWLIWKGDQMKQQLLQLGFIPYYWFDKAMETSRSRQTGSRRGPIRQAHVSLQLRNFMCAHLNRNDSISRRFLQYISAETNRVVTLVRDVKTGRILKTPPEEHLWLVRTKSGFDRASRTEWENVSEVGPDFFAKMEEFRQWHFGFKEYYDVYIWDLEPGEPFASLYNTIQQALFRAHRFCTTRDFYNPQRPILETLTREVSTMRVRDIDPGEQVKSIWDDIVGGRTVSLDIDKQGMSERESWGESSFYSEADAVEDTVLFPEETSTGDVKTVYKANNSAIDNYVSKGPDWVRFILDLDTDEDVDDDETSSDGETNYLIDDGLGDGTSSNTSHDHTVEDQSIRMESGPLPSEAVYAALCQDALSTLPDSSPECSSNKQNSLVKRQQRVAGPLEEDEAQKLRSLLTDNQKKDLDLLKSCGPPTYEWGSDPRKDFAWFKDREKSKAFKRCWHRADLHPGSNERYREQNELVSRVLRHETTERPFQFIHDLGFVKVHPAKDRLVVRDASEARGIMLSHFPQHLGPELKDTIKDSLIVNQQLRALNPPMRRSYLSNPNRPKEFWQEWDDLKKKRCFTLDSGFPQDWDVAIRPVVAKLYKESIIRNAYIPYAPAYAFAAREPGRELDFCCDLRNLIPEIKIPAHIVEPPSTHKLMQTARVFSEKHRDARFALLRLWSAAHFWPLMIGMDRRDLHSFADARGRTWEFNFCPKDFPFTERSMHWNSSMRINQYQHVLGRRVFVRRDLFLVMGENEEDLLKYATAATFAVISEPWRLEIDLWRSFINVDMAFLENLKEEWLD